MGSARRATGWSDGSSSISVIELPCRSRALSERGRSTSSVDWAGLLAIRGHPEIAQRVGRRVTAAVVRAVARRAVVCPPGSAVVESGESANQLRARSKSSDGDGRSNIRWIVMSWLAGCDPALDGRLPAVVPAAAANRCESGVVPVAAAPNAARFAGASDPGKAGPVPVTGIGGAFRPRGVPTGGAAGDRRIREVVAGRNVDAGAISWRSCSDDAAVGYARAPTGRTPNRSASGPVGGLPVGCPVGEPVTGPRTAGPWALGRISLRRISLGRTSLGRTSLGRTSLAARAGSELLRASWTRAVSPVCRPDRAGSSERRTRGPPAARPATQVVAHGRDGGC